MSYPKWCYNLYIFYTYIIYSIFTSLLDVFNGFFFFYVWDVDSISCFYLNEWFTETQEMENPKVLLVSPFPPKVFALWLFLAFTEVFIITRTNVQQWNNLLWVSLTLFYKIKKKILAGGIGKVKCMYHCVKLVNESF